MFTIFVEVSAQSIPLRRSDTIYSSFVCVYSFLIIEKKALPTSSQVSPFDNILFTCLLFSCLVMLWITFDSLILFLFVLPDVLCFSELPDFRNVHRHHGLLLVHTERNTEITNSFPNSEQASTVQESRTSTHGNKNSYCDIVRDGMVAKSTKTTLYQLAPLSLRQRFCYFKGAHCIPL